MFFGKGKSLVLVLEKPFDVKFAGIHGFLVIHDLDAHLPSRVFWNVDVEFRIFLNNGFDLAVHAQGEHVEPHASGCDDFKGFAWFGVDIVFFDDNHVVFSLYLFTDF